jgi:hypothetical protein
MSPLEDDNNGRLFYRGLFFDASKIARDGALLLARAGSES